MARSGALTHFRSFAEKGPARTGAGKRIRGGQSDQFTLHGAKAFGRAQAGIELLGGRWFSDKIIRAVVERLDQHLLVGAGGHQDDEDGAVIAGRPSRFGAQFQTTHGGGFGTGNQGVHSEVGLDVGERLPSVGKRADIMLVRFQQTGNEFQDGGARINQNDAHPIIQPLLRNDWL
jgi:hypothetical protein